MEPVTVTETEESRTIATVECDGSCSGFSISMSSVESGDPGFSLNKMDDSEVICSSKDSCDLGSIAEDSFKIVMDAWASGDNTGMFTIDNWGNVACINGYM